jgi:hypothetical protein
MVYPISWTYGFHFAMPGHLQLLVPVGDGLLIAFVMGDKVGLQQVEHL